MDLIGVCEPSITYSRVQVKAIDSLPKSSIKGALMVSENSLILQSEGVSPEALCLRDLELCRNGMTISFWILALPTTTSNKSWPILQLTSLSGSELTVDLFRNDGQYFLNVSVKSLHTIRDGKATSALWNVNPHVENLDENWKLVTISWSHVVGLSAKFNGTMVVSDRQPSETISPWEVPIHKGVWFGHHGNPDNSDGVVIDDFQFIPAELNYLDHVGQKIDVTLSNQNLNPCRLDTCWDGSSCYPISRKIDSLGPLCRCGRPRRVCRELPVRATVSASTFSSTRTTQAPTTIALMTISTTPLIISGQSVLPRTTIASTTQPLNSSTTPKATPSMPLINEILQSTPGQFSSLQGRRMVAGDPSHDFNLSVSHNSYKRLLPKCDPPCQNGGKCVEFNGHLSCDCSVTAFWGNTCVREHVGWLSQTRRVSKIEPRRRTFAAYNTVHGGSKMRLIFKTPISAIMPDKRVKKSIAAIQRSEYMVLLSVQTELGTLGLVTINSDLYILIKGVKKSMAQLLPCPQSREIITDDTLTHVIQLEHRSALLRMKVDGIELYPMEVMPSSCDKWLFFSPFHHINNSTYEETAIPQSNGFSLNSGKMVLGAWPDGEGEFKGAIGGWMIDGEEMFSPVTNEPEDTPNTVYRLSTRFYLSNGEFYWIRLHSLTPVTVLSDYPPFKTSPTLTVTLWFWIVGCISMGLMLLFICCWACFRVCRQQKDERKTTWRRNYFPLHPTVARSRSESSHVMIDKEQYYPTLVNVNGLTPEPRRLKSHSLTCKVESTVTTDNYWRARMLTLQSYQPVRSGGDFDYASMKKASMGSIYSHEERDDIEKILVTPEGDSVITLSTNHGTSVKQWSTYDGKYNREIVYRKNDSTQNESSRLLVLQRGENLLLTDEHNFAQLYPLRAQIPIASVQLPSAIWGAFPIGEEFLFVSDPMTGYEKDCFATLHFWSPSNKCIVLQNKLKVKHQWHAKGFSLQGAKKLPPLLGPNQANLLLRWIRPGLPDTFFSIAVDLISFFKPQHGCRKSLTALNSPISTSLVKHDINLEKTVFLADDIVVTGDVHGALHIWNIHSGENYRSVQSDPIPFDGPLLTNPGQHDFSQIKMDFKTGPITALAATEPSPTEAGVFTWFCSGDDSGCVVVRRCVVSANESLKNVASRIHAKFRPYSRTTLAYSADAVTCTRILNRSNWRTNKPEAFLATGDSSGCIRIWLLPQCTQLAQLSASCESGLLDLELTESAPSLTVPCQWLQVVGLVRRDKTGYEHGHVVIIHLIANEENGVPNAMHSPRLRIASKQ